MTHGELRWLIAKGIALHACEITPDPVRGRQFISTDSPLFPSNVCFVLSDRGFEMLRPLSCDKNLARHDEQVFVGNHAPATIPNRAIVPSLRCGPVPCWDAHKRELWLDGLLVKRYRNRAVNQQRMLIAFQEEGWRARIDDPLPPKGVTDPRRRLNDTVRQLNLKQINELIRFRSDGLGTGILWERINNQT